MLDAKREPTQAHGVAALRSLTENTKSTMTTNREKQGYRNKTQRRKPRMEREKRREKSQVGRFPSLSTKTVLISRYCSMGFLKLERNREKAWNQGGPLGGSSSLRGGSSFLPGWITKLLPHQPPGTAGCPFPGIQCP